jgi:hypothetical protein
MPSNVPEMRPSTAGDPPSPLASRSDFSWFHNYAPWANVVLGLLVFVLRYASPRGSFDVHWNLFLTGLVIMFAAFASIIAHDGKLSRNYWSAINIAAGVWLLFSVKIIPSVLQVTVAQVALGALVLAVALVSLAIEVFQTQARRERTQQE